MLLRPTVRLALGLHFAQTMRAALSVSLAVVVASVALPTIGCGDASPTGGIARRGPPAAGSDEQHDPGDTDGANVEDPGNPNASTPPPAPASPGATAAQYAVAVDNATPAADLGAQVDVNVTVTPQPGFTGAVDLSVAGLPAGVTGTFAPTQVNVGGAAATAKLTLAAAHTAIPSAPTTSSALTISAKSGTATATANANFKVNPRLLMTIPMNIDALRAAVGTKYVDQWGAAFGATPVTFRTQAGNGIVVTVRNADSVPHIVHGANGFAHGDTANPIAPSSLEMTGGAVRTRTFNPANGNITANGYPHEGANGPSVSFRLNVSLAP